MRRSLRNPARRSARRAESTLKRPQNLRHRARATAGPPRAKGARGPRPGRRSVRRKIIMNKSKLQSSFVIILGLGSALGGCSAVPGEEEGAGSSATDVASEVDVDDVGQT